LIKNFAARIVSDMAENFLQTSGLKSNLGTDPDGYDIFNSRTKIARVCLAMKPNIDLFNSGYWRNKMLKPLPVKGFTCFL
jgi:hypothetical protein